MSNNTVSCYRIAYSPATDSSVNVQSADNYQQKLNNRMLDSGIKTINREMAVELMGSLAEPESIKSITHCLNSMFPALALTENEGNQLANKLQTAMADHFATTEGELTPSEFLNLMFKYLSDRRNLEIQRDLQVVPLLYTLMVVIYNTRSQAADHDWMANKAQAVNELVQGIGTLGSILLQNDISVADKNSKQDDKLNAPVNNRAIQIPTANKTAAASPAALSGMAFIVPASKDKGVAKQLNPAGNNAAAPVAGSNGLFMVAQKAKDTINLGHIPHEFTQQVNDIIGVFVADKQIDSQLCETLAELSDVWMNGIQAAVDKMLQQEKLQDRQDAETMQMLVKLLARLAMTLDVAHTVYNGPR
ncbi:hypothetical protein GW590_06335 [Rahnella sp. SAP-1]|uniref:Uncharacterized protein n=1 Tax=Rouxiella aceris TaxID=2703884 RepID=A0A848MFM0_9GAMM|nr:hypothetical protein [Rouxiella aceris]NMP26485.1 hypothetical protein [Rouxiella aceris]